MKSLFSFIVKPKTSRYNNSKDIDGKELVLNTEMSNHKFVSREGIVLETPLAEKTDIQKGDIVIVHHNVFRRFNDIHGKEVNSKSFFKEDTYFVYSDQIFLYKRDNDWIPQPGFSWVAPIKNKNVYSNEKEQPLIGIMVYLDDALKNKGINAGDLVGFIPTSEYEFVIDGRRLYRVPNNSISIIYEYQGDEEEYHSSWAQSS